MIEKYVNRQMLILVIDDDLSPNIEIKKMIKDKLGEAK
jgi:hypothetical protein